MKSTILTLLLATALCVNSYAQSTETRSASDLESIDLIFTQMEIQGVDTKQKLLYGYFFFDADKSKLEKLKNHLATQDYQFVALDKKDNGKYMLHVEKIEPHTRQSLYETEQKLKQLAAKYEVSSSDGFDVGNVDPTKPIVTNDSFAKFMSTKKGNQLFDLGIKLYDLEIDNRAETVFTECIRLNIKPDTSLFKLGNVLLRGNKLEEGIKCFKQAIKYNPGYLKAIFNLGATYYDNLQFQESVFYYQMADKIKPNDDRIVYGIAASQYALEQFDLSLENCKRVLLLNKDHENAKVLLRMLKEAKN